MCSHTTVYYIVCVQIVAEGMSAYLQKYRECIEYIRLNKVSMHKNNNQRII